MSFVQRYILEDGKLHYDDGRPAAPGLGLTFDDEKVLDEKLWMDPENATDTLKYLLRQHGGEVTSTLARLGLKSLALPLFKREFARNEPLLAVEDALESDQYTDYMNSLEDEIEGIQERNGRLLGVYLSYFDDERVDQDILEQTITDVSVFQLIARNTEDIVLLPIGPDNLATPVATGFTVLRRQNLGRAHLIVSNGAKIAHLHNPNVLRNTIQLSTEDIVGPDGDIYVLASALNHEYDAVTDSEQALIDAADERLRAKINAHFDSVESK